MFKTLALSFLVAGQVAEAFKPAPFVNKMPVSGSVGNSGLWTPTVGGSTSSSSGTISGPTLKTKTIMDMVAGGAERSQGDDYYEGEFWRDGVSEKLRRMPCDTIPISHANMMCSLHLRDSSCVLLCNQHIHKI